MRRVVASWGNGDFGRLGHGQACLSEEVPKLCAMLSEIGAQQVACGGAHTAVVAGDHMRRCQCLEALRHMDNCMNPLIGAR